MELKERAVCPYCKKNMERGTSVAMVKIYARIKAAHPKCFEKQIKKEQANRPSQYSFYSS